MRAMKYPVDIFASILLVTFALSTSLGTIVAITTAATTTTTATTKHPTSEKVQLFIYRPMNATTTRQYQLDHPKNSTGISTNIIWVNESSLTTIRTALSEMISAKSNDSAQITSSLSFVSEVTAKLIATTANSIHHNNNQDQLNIGKSEALFFDQHSCELVRRKKQKYFLSILLFIFSTIFFLVD